MRKKKLRVIDFFCGAGGFSEGFRQQGFDVVMGIDNWQPAVDTHNLNHGLKDKVKDVLDFWGKDSSDVKDINDLPATEVIVGSPSCVSFSMSNKAGKADKTSGIKLIESYLRVVAVKKHEKKSVLKAWYMENVPQSKSHIKPRYNFNDLNLGGWAKSIGKNPEDLALTTGGEILNVKDYGAPQRRERFIAGEWIESNEFVVPEKTQISYINAGDIRGKMPKPNEIDKNKKWRDPNYPGIVLKTEKITDHFYDTGIYEIEWEKSEYLKTNHPFMGKMPFPEDENKPCRTILATRSASSRESIVYKSEYNRYGNGEYRSPTIREVASLMGFPYVYQFAGSEGVKWRQIGNAVCPHMSNALAKAIRKKMKLPEIKRENIDFSTLKRSYLKIKNLNTFHEKKFDNPKKRNTNARFRRHPLKLGNMTVDLMNYHPEKKDIVADKWHIGIFFGTGDDHKVKMLDKNDLPKIENILCDNFPHFKPYGKTIEKSICTGRELQKIYEEDVLLNDKDNPVKIVKRLAKIILSHNDFFKDIEVKDFFPKEKIPLAQLMAMYGLLKLID